MSRWVPLHTDKLFHARVGKELIINGKMYRVMGYSKGNPLVWESPGDIIYRVSEKLQPKKKDEENNS